MQSVLNSDLGGENYHYLIQAMIITAKIEKPIVEFLVFYAP